VSRRKEEKRISEMPGSESLEMIREHSAGRRRVISDSECYIAKRGNLR
jgi:hypothetical protein